MMSKLTVVIALLALSSRAYAEDPTFVPLEIAACAKIRQNSERLACFDRAVIHLESGAAAEGTKPAPSAEDMFGINASTPTVKPEEKEDHAQVEAIKAKVKAVRQGGGGVILELDNGQTWRQVQGSNTLLIKNGDEVKITRGALGSFNLTTPSGRIAKVKRLQ
jgi:hypothetical protein